MDNAKTIELSQGQTVIIMHIMFERLSNTTCTVQGLFHFPGVMLSLLKLSKTPNIIINYEGPMTAL